MGYYCCGSWTMQFVGGWGPQATKWVGLSFDGCLKGKLRMMFPNYSHTGSELIHQTPGSSPKTVSIINSVHFVNELQGSKDGGEMKLISSRYVGTKTPYLACSS